jgi:hypothetical protein
MKKILLTLMLATLVFTANTQVLFSVRSPSNIAGLYSFTSNGNGTNWGLANINSPIYCVEDTLMLVNDGSVGLNAQGNPISAEGCGTLVNDLTGKIAVLYRWDGVGNSHGCGFGTRALNAQNAGARAVIVINREPGLIGLDGGTDGKNVNIPVVLVTQSDGAALVNAMNNGSVVVLLGNKQNHYTDDIGTLDKDILVAKEFSNPTLLSQNAIEYNLDLGLKIRNFGTNNQTGATATAKIINNGNTIYNETSSLFNILTGDSTIVKFPKFSKTTYPAGRYTLSYKINNSVTDKDTTDNIKTVDFMINDTLYSLAPLDALTNLPIKSIPIQPVNFNTNYDACIAFVNSNASRMQVEGLYFAASTKPTDSLSGEEIVVTTYEITDAFSDLTNVPNQGNVNVFPLTQGFFVYPEANQANLQGEFIYQPFDQIVALEDNKRYLFCAQASSKKISIEYNTKFSYEKNLDSLLQPLVPVITDSKINLDGFGASKVPAISVKMARNTVGLTEMNNIEMNVFPNPTKGNLTITIPENGNGSIRITDIAGKTIVENNVIFVNNQTTINTDNLETGIYIVNVIVNSKVAQTTIVKQ